MNTRVLMTASAVIMGLTGLTLTFLPGEIAGYYLPHADAALLLGLQILGALYFAFAMLNWMTKGSLIGGIYNRPIAVANFTHFFIGALALLKAYPIGPDPANAGLVLAAGYVLFAVLFGLVLFRHPVREPKVKPVQ